MGEAKRKREAEIDELLKIAVEAKLEGLDFLSSFTYAQLSNGYNGIGPEFLPSAVREKVTKYLAIFEPAALIHDMRNHVGDGSRYGFNFANIEFRGNCLKLADIAHPWYSWRRYRARAVAFILFDFVQGQPGWVAWCEASRKNLVNQNNKSRKEQQ